MLATRRGEGAAGRMEDGMGGDPTDEPLADGVAPAWSFLSDLTTESVAKSDKNATARGSG